MGDHPGLAAPRAGQDEQRALDMLYGVPLRFGQTLEQVHRMRG